ncbi:hypothetical protein GRF29_103g455078 [Pseudopithomyces chartarum]|uniref:Protein SQS1 n=1 Tax=Pseudopithomyces chartarum TaxID=1892770 RepID=A0AAN6LXW5_9PLEO|nr:hypothetical protein GRF29_103g455078 [Pseudopithomyces chartarum]
MAKKKGKGKGKSTPKGTPKGTPKHAPRHSLPSHTPRSHMQEAVSAVAQRFSLRDEARYMSSHRSPAFDSAKKLRHMPIAFVSAGCLEGTVKEKEPALEPSVPAPAPTAAFPPCSPVATEALAQMTIRSPSPAPSAASSASSEEVIVFRGRIHTPLAQDSPLSPPTNADSLAPVASLATASPLDSVTTRPAPSTDNSLPAGKSPNTRNPPNTGSAAANVPDESIMACDTAAAAATRTAKATAASPHDESDVDSDTNSVIDSHFQKRRGGKARWESQQTEWVSRSKPGIGWLPVDARPDMDAFLDGEVNPRDAAMDDYMQNADANGELREMIAASGFARREMDLDGGSHNDWESDGGPDIPPELEHDDGWTSDMARDLDGLSTSTDVEGTVVRIVGHRTRTRGLQYQVVYEGHTRDDSRWLPVACLTTPSNKVLIEAYEAKRLAREEGEQVQSTSDSELGFYTEADSSEDESEVDDEQFARALQKQEELGIDDDDLVLYAADAHFSASNAPRATMGQQNKRRQQRAGGGGRNNNRTFPSASALADAVEMDPYAGFDIMDTERPSLRLKKKGRKGQMPPELLGDDSDLNEQLQSTWAADRAKKRLKKAEREELRKQGLLGRKGKAPDLSVKYKDGVSMEDIIEEIRDFMASEMQTLALPPMEAHRRAGIHQFVNEFNINSKSRGDGAGRFMVLSKTSRTFAFDDELFDEVMAQKKYNRRLLARSFNQPPPRQKKDKGAKTRPMVSYKDGEVVGAKAPELGVENKGRAMLEKMGWSKGMALGALDNKGILQPIAHTVKITKAGLR